MMTSTNQLLETMAIGLASLLALTILIRAHDVEGHGTMLPVQHAISSTTGSAQVARKPAPSPALDPNDEVRRILADMALHD